MGTGNNEGSALLLFELDTTRFAAPVADVREVLPGMTLTPLPGAPPVVLGAMNRANVAIPVLSLRRRFALPERAMLPSDHLIVFALPRGLTALHVDRVLGIERLDAARRVDAGTLWVHERSVRGVVQLDGGLVFLEDPAAFLDDTEALALEAALGGGPP